MFSVCPASKETGLGVASIGIISFRVVIALKATALADYLVGAIPSARERPMPSGEADKWFSVCIRQIRPVTFAQCCERNIDVCTSSQVIVDMSCKTDAIITPATCTYWLMPPLLLCCLKKPPATL